MAKYNYTLDLLGLAVTEQLKGNSVNAAFILMAAAQEPSAEHALRMIEATNAKAVAEASAAHGAQVEAAAKSGEVKAAPVVAGVSFEKTDEKVTAVLHKLAAKLAPQEPAKVQASEEVDANTLKLAKALAKALAETK